HSSTTQAHHYSSALGRVWWEGEDGEDRVLVWHLIHTHTHTQAYICMCAGHMDALTVRICTHACTLTHAHTHTQTHTHTNTQTHNVHSCTVRFVCVCVCVCVCEALSSHTRLFSQRLLGRAHICHT